MCHIYCDASCCLINLVHLYTCFVFLDQLLVGFFSTPESHQNSGAFLAQNVTSKPHPFLVKPHPPPGKSHPFTGWMQKVSKPQNKCLHQKCTVLWHILQHNSGATTEVNLLHSVFLKVLCVKPTSIFTMFQYTSCHTAGHHKGQN